MKKLNSFWACMLLAAAAALGYAEVGNIPPVAVISAPANGTEDIPVAFDGLRSSDEDGDPLTYAWDFGDGSTGEGATPVHAYTAGGTYTVTLTVNDGQDDSEPATAEITIAEVNDPPVADAGPDQSAPVGQIVYFSGSDSYDIDDGIASYRWDFGDMSPAENGRDVSHTYKTAGVYSVKLTVTDKSGATGTDTASVTVTEPSEVATLFSDISMDLDKRSGEEHTFVRAVASVRITGEASPVSGADVYGHWNSAPDVIVTGITDQDGWVIFKSQEVEDPAKDTEFTFTVTDVVKPGYRLDGWNSGAITYKPLVQF